METITTLDKLPLNENGKIENIECIGNIKRRLLDLGLVKGTKIFPVLVSPSKDPRAFFVRGSIIAIRKEEAQNIQISYFPQ